MKLSWNLQKWVNCMVVSNFFKSCCLVSPNSRLVLGFQWGWSSECLHGSWYGCNSGRKGLCGPWRLHEGALFYTPFLSVPEQTGGQVLTHKIPTNFISGCAQAEWCKEAGIECSLQRRLWERVVTCDFATNAYAVYHWGAQPSPCQSKKEIGYLCSGSRTLLSFSDIHNRSEEDCQADHWEKPFENLLILNQLLFASVIIIRYQLPCVRAVLFPSFHVLGQCACLLGKSKKKEASLCSSLNCDVPSLLASRGIQFVWSAWFLRIS